MGLKNINYKQILLDRGERIGLGAAGVIALFLVASLFFPGMGFMSGSASSNADALAVATKSVENGLAANKPTEADNPGDPTQKLTAFKFDVMGEDKLKQYAIGGLFRVEGSALASRGMPELKQPTESRAAVIRLQMPAFVFDSDVNPKALMVLEDAPSGGASGKMAPGMPNNNMLSKLYGNVGGGQSPLNPQSNLPAGRVRHKISHKGDGSDQEDFKFKFVDIGKISSINDQKLAETVYPVRGVEIVASFPYKAQVEEFRNKLGLALPEQVLAEQSQETDKDKQLLPAFRFLGVRLERRPVDAQGKPADAKGGWTEVNLEDDFKTLVILNGKRFEEEDPKLAPLAFANRLVMRKLITFGDRRVPPVDEYPKLEEELPNLKTAMDAVNSDPTKIVAAPSIINRDFNVFDLDAGSSQQAPGGAKSPMGLTPSTNPFGGSPAGGRVFVPPSYSSSPNEGAKGAVNGAYGAGFLQKDQSFTLPEYILIRLFDVTAEPGKTYEYRMQVRMANPNKDRTDAASQGVARQPELPAKDWYVLPDKVTVPLDVNFYAVDQAKLDAAAPPPAPKDPSAPKEPKEPKAPLQPVKENQTVLQIQKWLETLKIRGQDNGIGDWVIAERVVATRGEPISPPKVEVPYWRKTQDRFTLASDAPSKSGRRAPPQVNVPFSDGEEPILVDFTGGDATYKPIVPTPKALPVVDKGAAVEVLLLMPDGTLSAHDSAKDAADEKRISRLKENREWIHEVKNTKGGKDKDTPFGPPGASPFNPGS